MPLEATGDVLIYTALAAAATNDTAMAQLYLPTLRTFAEYVAQNGRDPLLQLYTDDYLGPSALNANLAAKSVVALAAYAQICAKLGPGVARPNEAQRYVSLARAYASHWHAKAAGGLAGATKRTFDAVKAGSFSAKTNLLFDVLLGTELLATKSVVEAECDVYRQTARRFGWLLDERGLVTNKTNIETELVVSLCSAADQEDFYGRVVEFLAVTPRGWAFTDTYDVVTAARLGGEGRSQIAGVFAPLALRATRGKMGSFGPWSGMWQQIMGLSVR